MDSLIEKGFLTNQNKRKMMKIITVQPKQVGKKLMKGETVYPNDREIVKFHTNGFDDGFLTAYHFMIQNMYKKNIKGKGHSLFPFWGWSKFAGKNIPELTKKDKKKLDFKKRKDCLITFSIDPRDILLSEFDSWNVVINNKFLNTATNDADYDKIEAIFNSLNPEVQYIEKINSWNKIFDLSLFNNDYIGHAEYVQGTFWEIRPENVISVEFV